MSGKAADFGKKATLYARRPKTSREIFSSHCCCGLGNSHPRLSSGEGVDKSYATDTKFEAQQAGSGRSPVHRAAERERGYPGRRPGRRNPNPPSRNHRLIPAGHPAGSPTLPGGQLRGCAEPVGWRPEGPSGRCAAFRHRPALFRHCRKNGNQQPVP